MVRFSRHQKSGIRGESIRAFLDLHRTIEGGFEKGTFPFTREVNLLALGTMLPNPENRRRAWFGAQMASGFPEATVRRHQEVVQGHGRTDVLTYYHFSVPTCIPGRSQWTGLRSIGVAIRESHQGDKVTREVRYFICSIRVSVKTVCPRSSRSLGHRKDAPRVSRYDVS
jgi:hypothetical protein